MTSSTPRICRISSIPRSWDEATVRSALRQHDVKVQPGPLHLMPSCLDPGMSTATVAIITSDNPILQKIFENPLESEIFPFHGASLVIDQNFGGLTTLACPREETKIEARVIVVHGLSGNAFGSWSSYVPRSGQHVCWLRDFLAQDCPNLHVMTYGYESRLDKTTTVSTLVDYRRAFLRDMTSFMTTVQQDPPLIYMGHSFGGMVITQALQAAKLQAEKVEYRRILKHLAGIFFFGVPQRGLRTDELRDLTRERSEESKTKVLEDMQKDSDILRQSIEFLASLSLDVQMVSVYEEKPTPTPVKKEGGGWARTGAGVVMVNQQAAVLNVPNEALIPVTGDHNTIIKFTHRDNHYTAIKNQLQKILAETITSPRARDERHTTSPNQRSLSSEPDIFSVAFGVSGASEFARKFVAGFHTVIAAYEETSDTHPAFIDLRFRCWMFITWLEIMKASWKSACLSGFAQSCLSTPAVMHLVGPLKGLVQEAGDILKDVMQLKDRHGSFESSDMVNAGHGKLHSLTANLQVCVDRLHSFATPYQRHLFTEESTAVTLVASQDDVLQKLGHETAASLPRSLTEGAQLKRELQSIRTSPMKTKLWKPLSSVLNETNSDTVRRSIRLGGLRLATFHESGGSADSKMSSLSGSAPSREAPQRVLIEWTTVSPKWKPEHVQLGRSRLTRLVQELNIESKPVTLRVLHAIGLVEDFRDERNRRFGILFSLRGVQASAVQQPTTLHDMLPANSSQWSPMGEPLLGDRFDLALALATAVHELHRSGWLHKELRSANVAFLFGGGEGRDLSSSVAGGVRLPDLTRPYITGFGFARPDEEGAVSLPTSTPARCSDADLFRHPLLRRVALGDTRDELRAGAENRDEEEKGLPRFRRRFDVYSLGLILLEIGLWERISSFGQPADKDDPIKYATKLKKLCFDHVGHRMGAIYRDVVLQCLHSRDSNLDASSEDEDEDAGEEMMSFYFGVVQELEKCQCGRRG